MFALRLFEYALLVLLLLLVVAFVWVCIYLHRVHLKYSHIPGPKRTSFFGGHVGEILHQVEKRKVSLAQLGFEWQKEYGPVFVIFSFHRPLVFISDPATVKTLLMNNIHPKPDMYDLMRNVYGMRCLGGGLVSETDHAKWSIHRKIFNLAFYRKELMNLMGHFNESSDKLVLKLKQNADTGSPFPLMDGLNRVTLDVVAKAALGMTEELIFEDSLFTEAIQLTLQGILRQFHNPFGWLNPFQRGYRQKVRRSISFLRNYGEDLILKRLKDIRDGKEQPRNVLNTVLTSFEATHGSFDLDDMVDEFLTFFVAGQETTSNMIGFALLEIGKRPDIEQRLRAEIDAVIGDKEFIEYQDVMKMEYCLMVLKETLRLWGPATGTSRDAAHDLVACGYKIPAGTNCQLSHYIMVRMEQFFKNPMEFNPERFAKDEDTPLYAYFPFSLGARSCIGQQFALIEARVILAKLFQNYKLKVDMMQSFEVLDQLTLKPKDGCMNYIYTREKAAQ